MDLVKLQDLFEKGYRVVSRKHKHIARVDVTDEEMIAYFVKQNYGSTEGGVAGADIEHQRDHYRRCVSEDMITLKHEEMREFIRLQNNGLVYTAPQHLKNYSRVSHTHCFENLEHADHLKCCLCDLKNEI